MNLVTLERSMPRHRPRGVRPGLLAPGVARAMARTMSMMPSAMPMLYGGGDPFEYWQPSAVSGFALDINPHFKMTTGLNGARVTCASVVNNKSGATDAFANVNPSLQPTFESAGWGGAFQRPSILFDGAAYYLTSTTSVATALVGGTDTPFTLFIVGHFVALPGAGLNACLIYVGSTTSNNPLWDFFASNTGGDYRVFKRGNAGGSAAVTGGTPNTTRHVFSFVNTSAPAVTGSVDGSSVLSGALSAGSALTVDSICLGSTYGAASPNNWANFRLARLLAFTGALATQDVTDVTAMLTAMYL